MINKRSTKSEIISAVLQIENELTQAGTKFQSWELTDKSLKSTWLEYHDYLLIVASEIPPTIDFSVLEDEETQQTEPFTPPSMMEVITFICNHSGKITLVSATSIDFVFGASHYQLSIGSESITIHNITINIQCESVTDLNHIQMFGGSIPQPEVELREHQLGSFFTFDHEIDPGESLPGSIKTRKHSKILRKRNDLKTATVFKSKQDIRYWLDQVRVTIPDPSKGQFESIQNSMIHDLLTFPVSKISTDLGTVNLDSFDIPELLFPVIVRLHIINIQRILGSNPQLMFHLTEKIGQWEIPSDILLTQIDEYFSTRKFTLVYSNDTGFDTMMICVKSGISSVSFREVAVYLKNSNSRYGDLTHGSVYQSLFEQGFKANDLVKIARSPSLLALNILMSLKHQIGYTLKGQRVTLDVPTFVFRVDGDVLPKLAMLFATKNDPKVSKVLCVPEENKWHIPVNLSTDINAKDGIDADISVLRSVRSEVRTRIVGTRKSDPIRQYSKADNKPNTLPNARDLATRQYLSKVELAECIVDPDLIGSRLVYSPVVKVKNSQGDMAYPDHIKRYLKQNNIFPKAVIGLIGLVQPNNRKVDLGILHNNKQRLWFSQFQPYDYRYAGDQIISKVSRYQCAEVRSFLSIHGIRSGNPVSLASVSVRWCEILGLSLTPRNKVGSISNNPVDAYPLRLD